MPGPLPAIGRRGLRRVMWLAHATERHAISRRTTFLAVIHPVGGLRRHWVSLPALSAGKDTQSLDGQPFLLLYPRRTRITCARSRVSLSMFQKFHSFIPTGTPDPRKEGRRSADPILFGRPPVVPPGEYSTEGTCVR